MLCLDPSAVSVYTLLLDAALLGAAAMAHMRARRCGLKPVHVLDAVLATALGGVIGGRVAYVAANWIYYGHHLARALRLWDGGLSWHGGLLGGLAALLLFCAVQRVSPALMLDVLTPGAALIAPCAWLGCCLSRCAHGVETYPGQGLLWSLSLELPDLYGIQAPRAAVQLLGTGWGAVALGFVLLAGRWRGCRGALFPLWLAVYCAGSFALGFLRADVVPMLGGCRVDQVVDLALALMGAVAVAGRLLRIRARSGSAGLAP